MEDFKQYLSQVMQYEATGTGDHEWIFCDKKEAVQVANYLRSYGYKVTFKHYPNLASIACEFYVSVLKNDL